MARRNVVEKALEKVSKRKIGRHATLSTVVDEEITQKRGKLRQFSSEPAVVRVSMGSTLNMGNYQSLRLGVDLALPCEPAAVEAAFKQAASFVEKKLGELVLKNAPASAQGNTTDDVEL